MHTALSHATVFTDDDLAREVDGEAAALRERAAQIAGCYGDIAQLVGDQQAEVDEIGDLIERSMEHTGAGASQLGKASRGQSARGQLCCYVLVVLAVAVIGLGLYFTCTKSHFPPLGVCTQR